MILAPVFALYYNRVMSTIAASPAENLNRRLHPAEGKLSIRASYRLAFLNLVYTYARTIDNIRKHVESVGGKVTFQRYRCGGGIVKISGDVPPALMIDALHWSMSAELFEGVVRALEHWNPRQLSFKF